MKKTKEEMGKINYFKNLKGEFVMVPNEIVKCPYISPTAFRILVYLAMYEPIHPGYKKIMEHTGLAKGTVSKGLKELEVMGLIVQDKRGYCYGVQ